MSNGITAAATCLLRAIEEGSHVIDLARPYSVGMPQSPNHPAYWHAMPRRHGDMMRSDGASAANDMITMGTHVGTHVDALAHVSQDGLLHGGYSAAEAQLGGRFENGGSHLISPYVGRAVLLDIPALLGVERCEPGFEIMPEHLIAAEAVQNTPICEGEIAIVRSGWGQLWDDREAYIGASSGVPGVSEAGATWLADRGAVMAGSDTIAFERLAPGAGHALLPAHRVLLVERGVNIIETMALESLAATHVREFLLVLAPLHLEGATAAPVRPLAVVPA